MEFLVGITFFLFVLFIWAAIGHVMWVVVAKIFSGISVRSCPDCKRDIGESDLACKYCGWTSVATDAKQGLKICKQAMQSALQRKIIDAETLQRGEQILAQLEQAIDEDRMLACSGVAVPTLNSDEPVRLRDPEFQNSSQVPLVASSNEENGAADHGASIHPVTVAPVPILEMSQPSISDSATASLATSPSYSAVPVVESVHALDREYSSDQVTTRPELKPTRSWPQWFSAFMEESNIRWGELVGGLLIVCCTAALVISFWSHIAQRPWLKFSIFTGINMATFGLGLYAWHRWKLPTTSKGILVIGMMLLPLNFVAFALFTLGMPWDWPTVAGELISLAVLGYLCWQAAKVLTPTAVVVTTATPIAFALANLLIRRSVQDDTSVVLLYAWGGGLLGLYATSTAVAWQPLLVNARGQFVAALEYLALATFGLILSGGLLYVCSKNVLNTAHTTSPILALCAMPGLFYALDLGKRIPKKSKFALPILLIGAVAIAVGMIAMGLAWPTPKWMIGCTLAWFGLIAVTAHHYRFASLGYPVYLGCGAIVCMLWYLIRGELSWSNESASELMQTFANAESGFALVAWSLVCGVQSVALFRLKKQVSGVVALRSGSACGILGAIVLTAFGFGRAEYAVSVGSVYAICAAAAFAIGTIRRRPWVEVIGIVFLAAAAIQWIAVGWTDQHVWIRAFVCVASVAFTLLVMLILKRVLSIPQSPDGILVGSAFSLVVVTSLMVLIWMFIGETSDDFVTIPVQTGHFVVGTFLWILLAFVQANRPFWYVAQWSAITATAFATLTSAKQTNWFSEAPNGFLHPSMIQYWVMTLFATGTALLLLDWILSWINHTRFRSVTGPLCALHDSRVAHSSIAVGSVLLVVLLIYGAIPGSLQELIPRDSLASTEVVEFQIDNKPQVRTIPSLASLEFPSIPHAAASWGKGSDRFSVCLMRPGLTAWISGLIAIALVLWGIRQRGSTHRWAGLGLTLFLCLWFPIASQLEAGVAVASSLRWLTATVFFLGCTALCFWINRVDRASEPKATRLFAWFDHGFQVLSLNALAIWVIMGTVVVISVLSRAAIVPWTWWAWSITGLMASVSGILLLHSLRTTPELANSSGRSVAAITSSTLLIVPFVTWVVLQVSLTVIAHPLTGPNPDSLFVRMGLATSYAIPILMVSVAMVAVSAARPSPHLAFVSALLLMLTVVVGYMLVLKSEGMRVAAWIGLAACLSVTASIFSILWQVYTARDKRSDAILHWSGRQAKTVREEWQRALRHVSAGFAILGLGLISLLVLANGPSMRGLSWASLGLLVSLLVLLAYVVFQKAVIDAPLWFFAFGVVMMGIVSSLWVRIEPSLASAAITMGLAGVAMILQSLITKQKHISANKLNPIRYLSLVLAFLMIVAGRLVVNAFPSLGPATGTGLLPVLILAGAAGLAIANAWAHRDRASLVWSFLAAQSAALVYTLWYQPGSSPLNDTFLQTVLLQCSVMAAISGIGTLLGFGQKARVPLLVAITVIALMSAGWMMRVLLAPGLPSIASFPSMSFFFAIAMCSLGGLTGYWSVTSRDEGGTVYLSGLVGVIWLLQLLQPTSEVLLWVSAMILGAYCLGTSFLWRSGERIREEIARLDWFPTPVKKKSTAFGVVVMNIALAILVTWLGLAAQFLDPNFAIRFSCAQAIMAVSFAVGFLARYTSGNERSHTTQKVSAIAIDGSTAIRVLSLTLGVFYAIAFGWHFQSPSTTTFLDRMGVALLPLTLIGAVYGFGLIKWMGLKVEWQRASLLLMPAIIGFAIVGGVACVALELQLASEDPIHPFLIYTSFCIAIAILFALVLCIAAAILPGNDPFGLSEQWREVYVYAAQALLVLLVVHLRVSNSWLFQGLFQKIWPLLLLAVGFSGIALAEWAKRRGWSVLVRPLTNSGMLLPLLPVLAPWIANSQVDYGVTLISAAVGYGLFAYLQRSACYGAASVMAANGAIWYLLYRSDFSFDKHPQVWVIPPALCLFAAAQLFRKTLLPNQLAVARYISIGSIYVASTSEVFLQGIAEAPWLPIVLAFLSVLGIMVGIAARIRSMLWLGSLFLCVALFCILWYAAVDLEQTWIWYVSGIVLGIMILVIFAFLEKKREDLKRIMTTMQTWEE